MFAARRFGIVIIGSVTMHRNQLVAIAILIATTIPMQMVREAARRTSCSISYVAAQEFLPPAAFKPYIEEDNMYSNVDFGISTEVGSNILVQEHQGRLFVCLSVCEATRTNVKSSSNSESSATTSYVIITGTGVVLVGTDVLDRRRLVFVVKRYAEPEQFYKWRHVAAKLLTAQPGSVRVAVAASNFRFNAPNTAR